jgi:pyruvate ferredoxin oxidoreductase alpha subunit
MPVVNRALSAPINIHCDHSDTMGARDSGWIQIYCENAAEVYENVIMAVRIAEHPDIRLPVMVCQDGFITSHTLEAIETFDTETVSNSNRDISFADSPE